MREFWTIEKIKEGFERFRNQLEYLPTSRNIQKRFGGLAKLRSQPGYKDK